jgi:hypothetical protein
MPEGRVEEGASNHVTSLGAPETSQVLAFLDWMNLLIPVFSRMSTQGADDELTERAVGSLENLLETSELGKTGIFVFMKTLVQAEVSASRTEHLTDLLMNLRDRVKCDELIKQGDEGI